MSTGLQLRQQSFLADVADLVADGGGFLELQVLGVFQHLAFELRHQLAEGLGIVWQFNRA